MINVLLIFFAIIALPMIIALPFYLYQRLVDKKDAEAEKIMETLRGLSGPRSTRSTGLWLT